MKKTIEKENYLKSIYKLQEKKEDITVTALSIIFKVSKSTVSNMLKKANLKLQDFDFYEIHEAFAAQTLATLESWKSEDFCCNKLG